MEQFSLEKYLADPSRKVVTRDGYSVRIVCTDRISYHKDIIGLVMIDGSEYIFTWTQQGKTSPNSDTSNDLFFAPETHEGWINVYRNSDTGHTYAGAVYDSKEDAEKRKESGENYVTTIKIEWEE